MVNVRCLKPYHVTVDSEFVHIILAYQYFTITINDEVYKFVPTASKEIRINRITQQIDNREAEFAFRNGENTIHVPMNELIYLPDFLIQLYTIAKPYYEDDIIESIEKQNDKDQKSAVIDELELANKKRLIDKALDERDEDSFYALLNML
ncbi:IDEAL domain-containing protein [Oceanobacillus halotolerans]|uniref:IDEAL domain-containing protein n=1 Tax=Oceanobacillus halotolerans TaxID=2663380 RepID=UPI0013D98CBB|nr:IDEAL domain-containing protein [Oceanobacillus halotolerans]